MTDNEIPIHMNVDNQLLTMVARTIYGDLNAKLLVALISSISSFLLSIATLIIAVVHA